MTPVGIVGTPKTVAPQRLAITNENHRKRPAAKAGVAGSNPAGGTSVLAVQRPFFEIARGLWLPNDYIDPQGQPTASMCDSGSCLTFQFRLVVDGSGTRFR